MTTGRLGVGVTVTVAVALADCELFAHVIVNTVVVLGVTTNDPDVDVAVVHVAEHAVAFVDVHESVELAPCAIVDGFAVRVVVTAFPPPLPGTTVTVACASVFSPGLFVQKILYTVVWLGETTCDPVISVLVVQLAEQNFAFVAVQVRVLD